MFAIKWNKQKIYWHSSNCSFEVIQTNRIYRFIWTKIETFFFFFFFYFHWNTISTPFSLFVLNTHNNNKKRKYKELWMDNLKLMQPHSNLNNTAFQFSYRLFNKFFFYFLFLNKSWKKWLCIIFLYVFFSLVCRVVFSMEFPHIQC